MRDATIFRKHPNASTQCKALSIRNQNWYPSFTFMNNNGVLWWRSRNYSGADTRYWQGVGVGVSPHTIMTSLTNSHAIIALNHVRDITAISPSENVLQLIWIWNLTLCNSSIDQHQASVLSHLGTQITGKPSQHNLLVSLSSPNKNHENRWNIKIKIKINILIALTTILIASLLKNHATPALVSAHNHGYDTISPTLVLLISYLPWPRYRIQPISCSVRPLPSLSLLQRATHTYKWMSCILFRRHFSIFLIFLWNPE